MGTTTRRPETTRSTYDWQCHAACRGRDSEVFFGPINERGHARLYREHHAKQVCATCPVQQTCLNYALAAGEPYGVWGGLTPTERGQVPTRTPKPASAPSKPV